jgi:predicted GNAT superfamily acetyltransferase
MYGERTDALNAGVPTDRLIAEWDTTAKAIAWLRPDAAAVLPRLIHTRTGQGEEADSAGTPLPIRVEPLSGSPQVLLEVPADISRLRRARPDRAEHWRQIVRLAFGTAFEAGYRAVHVIRNDSAGERRVFYVLERTRDADSAPREQDSPHGVTDPYNETVTPGPSLSTSRREP